MTAADRLQVLLDRACRGVATPAEAEQLRADVAELQQQVAAFHEGEQPYEDERVVPTPSQWIWQWNRATPEQRLAKAAQVLGTHDRLDRVRQALLRHGARPSLASAVHAALNDQAPR
ncbi:hypothetical protein [Kitasatospora phosalacinea]|uniref:Uncharacterized protein n=1 Tax=Kitasatospora phosalacinea TaxID=2065 RepID=A0ABW6GRU9_9ACTN